MPCKVTIVAEGEYPLPEFPGTLGVKLNESIVRHFQGYGIQKSRADIVDLTREEICRLHAELTELRNAFADAMEFAREHIPMFFSLRTDGKEWTAEYGTACRSGKTPQEAIQAVVAVWEDRTRRLKAGC